VVGLLRGFWTRHCRKILVSLSVAGISYAAYRLYDVHRSQLVWVEKLRAREEEAGDELVKNQQDAPLFPPSYLARAAPPNRATAASCVRSTPTSSTANVIWRIDLGETIAWLLVFQGKIIFRIL
jgi:hypothetical protein